MDQHPDLLPMQFLLFPEFLHFLCFFPKGLRQLDLVLSHNVYLCKEKDLSYIYMHIYVYIHRNIHTYIYIYTYTHILEKTPLLKSTVVADTKLTPYHTSLCRNIQKHQDF